MKEEDFLKLTKVQAQNKAEGQNMIFRLISINGDPFFSYPTDVRTDRVCVEIQDGLVTVAKIV